MPPNPKVRVDFAVRTQQLTRGIKGIQSQFSAFQNQIRQISGVITGVFVTGAIARSVKALVDFGDQLQKTATTLGTTADQIASLRFVAERSGVTFEQLSVGLAQLQKNLLDFTRGTGEARVSFEALNLTADQAKELLEDPAQAFLEIADRMNRIESSGHLTAEAMRIFGESGRRLVPAIRSGREEIEELIDRNRQLVGSVNQFAADSEKLNDAFTDLKAAGTGLIVSVLGPLLPQIESLTLKLAELSIQLRDNGIQAFKDDLNSLAGDITEFSTGSRLQDFSALTKGILLELKEFVQVSSLIFASLVTGFEFALRGQFDALTGLSDFIAEEIKKIQDGNKAIREGFLAPPGSPVATLGANRPSPAALPPTTLPEEALFRQEAAVKAALADFLEAQGGLVDRVFALRQEVIGLTNAADFEKLRSAADKRGSPITDNEDQALRLKAETAELKLREEFSGKIFDIAINDAKRLRDIEEETGERIVEAATRRFELLEKLQREFGEKQEAMGRQIVQNETQRQQFIVDQARKQVEELQILQNEANAASSLTGREREGVNLLRNRDIAGARLNALRVEQDTTGEDRRLEISALKVQVAEANEAIKAFNVRPLTEGIESIGAIINNTAQQMVIGLLRGTQTMEELWKNFLLNTLANLFARAFQNLISKIFEDLAAQAAGSSIASVAGAFFGASGRPGGIAVTRFRIGASPVVRGFGFGDTVPSLLQPGEGVITTSGMKILDTLNKGSNPFSNGGSNIRVFVENKSEQRASATARQNGNEFEVFVELVEDRITQRNVGGNGQLVRGMAEILGLQRRPRNG